MKNAASISALLYTSLSAVAAAAFLAVTLAGEYSWVARLGGAAWVFGLSMIVTMPVITPVVKQRLEGKNSSR